jgi:NAD(P)-dependent dehydrogenase (short-subunit alcohol dehydrogenase family)
MPEHCLAGRLALVTGASQGIGRSLALAFAKAGAHVVAAARSRDKLDETVALIRNDGGSADAAEVDLRHEQSINDLAHSLHERDLAVDVLVNNSGIAGPTASLWETSPGDWDEVMAVNVRGVFLTCRAFLPPMIERRHGSVLVISSISGKTPLVGRTPYTASKLALVGMVRTLAFEIGPYGLRANLISPGAVEGSRVDRVIADQARITRRSEDEVRTELTAATALKRFVTAIDVADCAIFLASDHARSITGQDINVAAGAGFP